VKSLLGLSSSQPRNDVVVGANKGARPFPSPPSTPASIKALDGNDRPQALVKTATTDAAKQAPALSSLNPSVDEEKVPALSSAKPSGKKEEAVAPLQEARAPSMQAAPLNQKAFGEGSVADYTILKQIGQGTYA